MRENGSLSISGVPWRRTGAVAAAVALLATLVGPLSVAQAAPAGLQLSVLSNRADLISGGDALVRVALPAGLAPSKVRVMSAGRDVTKVFAVRPNGHFEGLVTKLPLGRSELKATASGASDSLTITNHPNGGPVFSGPQLKPWTCQPAAVDKQCNQPPTYEFLYKSSTPVNSAGFKPYNPASPPSDVATTKTDQGKTVPFIIRVETGYQDRDQYKIATLYQPGRPWKPWAPQEQWNHKVLMTHGHGCGAAYQVEEAPSVTAGQGLDMVPGIEDLPVSLGFDSPQVALARGFAVVSTALNSTVHNCNVVMNAESMMMAKERVVERYGPIRYTIGTGCSGGSIAQQSVANAYPGIYQGLIVTCSYPDAASPGAQFFDYHLMRKYFESAEAVGEGWTPLQWAAAEGHLLPVNAIAADEVLFKVAFSPTPKECPGISDQQLYHPDTNPDGTRCGVIDLLANQFGPRAKGVWTDVEKRLGKGFTGRPVDNVGIQYGLAALRSGAITPEMFVDLNSKIGGLDIDGKPQAERTVADEPALQRMYRDGWLNSANNLDTVAIIDHGGPDPAFAHDARWAWSMRDRLDREHGHHDNQVIWFGQVPLFGDANYPTEALLAMDRWLAAVEADHRDVPVADKIVQDRPGDLRDRCSQAQALSSPDGINLPLGPLLREQFGDVLGPILLAVHQGTEPVLDPALRLIVDPVLDAVCGAGVVGETLQTDFDTPRGVAGQSNTSDDHKCRLKPLNRDAGYGPAKFTDAQWAQLAEAFPDGVCDYSKPGVGKTDTVRWLTYQDCRGKVIYGGEPLGSAPAKSGDGWSSPAFRDWHDAGTRGDLGTCRTASADPSSGGATNPPAGSGGGAGGSGGSGGAEAGSAQATDEQLATTGSPIALAFAAAAWLLAAGGLTVRIGRRRQATLTS